MLRQASVAVRKKGTAALPEERLKRASTRCATRIGDEFVELGGRENNRLKGTTKGGYAKVGQYPPRRGKETTSVLNQKGKTQQEGEKERAPSRRCGRKPSRGISLNK